MTPLEFIKKWKPVALTERQTAQEHFIDLCRLMEHPTPVEADPTGESYCFEKGALKSSGNPGFADVWKKGYFAFEYKKKKKNLGEALKQLSQYAWNLENPPLNVACDTSAFKIVTAWTNTPSRTFDLTLDDLADPEKFAILHAVFHAPEKLRGHMTREMLTRDAADKFSGLAQRLQSRGFAPEAVAHFIMQLVFCFFAEDVKLLPDGFFRKAIRQLSLPQRYLHAKALLDDIFTAMAKGGRVGNEFLAYFNGGLFDGQAALPLDEGDVGLLIAAGKMEWTDIDPSIFGTLFERFLDPAKRAQIGAHYTDAKKILQIVDPVVMRPLEAEWAAVKAKIEALVAVAQQKGAKAKQWGQAETLRTEFIERLAHLRILDPACGSGNFLYIALQRVKDLEFRVNNECEELGLKAPTPQVGPEILFGIEINALAAEIARTTIWIGDIQWGLKHALYTRPEPVLRKLDQIECRDAVLERHGDGTYAEAQWPQAEFVIGNPPFLGTKKMRPWLGDEYVRELREAYVGRLSPSSDLVCWWFEKAHKEIVTGKAKRAGLVATNSIRGGRSRFVLDSIVNDLTIFEAWSDEPWVVDGAAVRVSLVCFGEGKEESSKLNGLAVLGVFSDLSPVTKSKSDVGQAKYLNENGCVAYQGVVPRGQVNKSDAKKLSLPPASFILDGVTARQFLVAPINPNGSPNSDVIFPFLVGDDIASRPMDRFIVDFMSMSEADAALYELPYAYIKPVKQHRSAMAQPEALATWWQHWRTRAEVRLALGKLSRFIATPRVSKYRLFVWCRSPTLPDNAVVAIARDDDTTFGILHSRFHEAWSLRLGTSLEDRPRYTPTTTFETFPFPEGLTPNILAKNYSAEPRAIRIAEAAKRLDDLRGAWLNPTDLVRVEPEVVSGYPDRILPKDQNAAAILAKRTLTNLYNERPQWLVDVHETLDRAVAAAYGWPEDISTDEALEKLLALNLARAGAKP